MNEVSKGLNYHYRFLVRDTETWLIVRNPA